MKGFRLNTIHTTRFRCKTTLTDFHDNGSYPRAVQGPNIFITGHLVRQPERNPEIGSCPLRFALGYYPYSLRPVAVRRPEKQVKPSEQCLLRLTTKRQENMSSALTLTPPVQRSHIPGKK